ncbi:hypothetical protein ACQHIV_03220 [Kribbella sp. GL6]|uniref:hypothetical protein n=1 Tax=Kribbella sp. GL6 TaxID=3419765 RepID=UPI003D03CA65
MISRKTSAVLAACLALPYVVSKVHFAMAGQLGVHGGPRVTADDYTKFGDTADVSAAQWGNVAAGTVIFVISLLPLAPFARRWNRWVLAVPVMAAGSTTAGFGLSMIVNGAVTGRGGYPFGAYSVVWGAMQCALARRVVGRTTQVRQPRTS